MKDSILLFANADQLVRERLLAQQYSIILSDCLDRMVCDTEYADAVAARSYRHELGFAKIVLACSVAGALRLHVWRDPTPSDRIDLHDHFWSFSSFVIRGYVHDSRWDFQSASNCVQQQFDHYELLPLSNGNFDLRYLSRVNLFPCAQRKIAAGEAYSLNAGTIHSSCASADTATLVLHGSRQISTNRVYRDAKLPSRHKEGGTFALRRAELFDFIESCVHQSF